MGRWLVVFLAVTALLALIPACGYAAANEIVVDGVLNDWSDETETTLDPFGDSTPARSDLVKAGIARAINTADPADDIVYLLCVSDTANGGGFQCVFTLTVNGTDTQVNIAVNAPSPNKDNRPECTFQAANSSAFIAAGAAGSVNKVYSGDDDDDCAVEVSIPITASHPKPGGCGCHLRDGDAAERVWRRHRHGHADLDKPVGHRAYRCHPERPDGPIGGRGRGGVLARSGGAAPGGRDRPASPARRVRGRGRPRVARTPCR